MYLNTLAFGTNSATRRICTYTAQHIGWNAVPCIQTGVPNDHWSAIFYNDTWNGTSWTHFAQRVKAIDDGLNVPFSRNWGLSSPSSSGCLVNTDHWSAYYQAYIYFTTGPHTFTAAADDGVQIVIDGTTVIDAFTTGPGTYSGVWNCGLTGTHRVVVQYYDDTGPANLSVSWN